MVSTLATKKRRETVTVTYRLSPETKELISKAASEDTRSENLEAEFLLKLGIEYRLIRKKMGQI